MSHASIVAAVLLALAVVLLIVETVAEVAVISLSRSRSRLLLSRYPENVAARRVHRIVERRERAMGSYAVGRTLAVVTGLSAGGYVVSAEAGFGWQETIATGAVGFVLLALAQAVPRRVATQHPEAFALLASPLMDALASLFLWPALVLESPAALITRLRHVPEEHTPELTELEVLLEHEDGGIEEGEREMIRRVIEIGDTPVHVAMIPRPDVVAVDVAVTLRKAAQTAVDRGFSRVPVYEGAIDNIIGILYAKDALAELLAGRDTPVRDLMRPPLFVPESKLIDDMLAEFRAARVHMAVVLDEYGGTAGIVTIEDLLEEIVGEIEDEYDLYTVAPVVRVDDNEAIIDGRAPLDALEEIFAFRPETEEFDTVGGFVFDRLGKIPAIGDEIRADGLRLSVLRMEGRRIARVRVQRVVPNDARPGEAPPAG